MDARYYYLHLTYKLSQSNFHDKVNFREKLGTPLQHASHFSTFQDCKTVHIHNNFLLSSALTKINCFPHTSSEIFQQLRNFVTVLVSLHLKVYGCLPPSLSDLSIFKHYKLSCHALQCGLYYLYQKYTKNVKHMIGVDTTQYF